MTDYSRYTQQEMEAEFLQELQELSHNPPTVRSLIKVPDGIMEDWKIFFQKMITYQEMECALITLTLFSRSNPAVSA